MSLENPDPLARDALAEEVAALRKLAEMPVNGPIRPRLLAFADRYESLMRTLQQRVPRVAQDVGADEPPGTR